MQDIIYTQRVSSPGRAYQVVYKCAQYSKNSYLNPKRPVNMLHGTDPNRYLIWKWDPNPHRPEKCLKCTTRTRRGPDHYSKVGPEPGWEDTDPTAPIPIGTQQMLLSQWTSCVKKKNLFALTTVSSPLPDCDAYNPPCQYISIHVRLFLSLAVWKSLLNPLISLFQLQKSTCCHGDGWLMQLHSFFFFHLESTSIVTFILLNYNNDTFCWL